MAHPTGDIAASDITFYRLQWAARATSAPTSPRAKFCLWPPVLSAASASLPSRGWARFYRRHADPALPRTAPVAFGHYGKALFEVFKFLGIGDIAYNQPDSLPYPAKNPWG